MRVKIKLSSRIRIGATNCRIKYVPHLEVDNRERGYLLKRTGEIGIEPELSDEMKNRTLIHEVIHQIDENYVIDITENDIERMANGFYEFLQNLHIELDWSGIK